VSGRGPRRADQSARLALLVAFAAALCVAFLLAIAEVGGPAEKRAGAGRIGQLMIF
jgi:hypothetical protein